MSARKEATELVELIRRKATMSENIVKKDADYGLYAGADYRTADTMAMLDTFLRLGLIPTSALPFIKLYRAFLNQRRKAFFASVGSTEITKLGFIKGSEDNLLEAT